MVHSFLKKRKAKMHGQSQNKNGSRQLPVNQGTLAQKPVHSKTLLKETASGACLAGEVSLYS